ncbi:FkbM family methyltransferase [Caenimonas koreensis]|uniref:FkbM family methyltransferase n=1 Tax=Caenimonas koreensis DSM 17982 TaxID=1121255 RepID=A0A844ATK0_9BURK|nr:FkbM family methyltransferase [Caenimonas koreensis]MRD47790.1 FkbM family methyltransferase [Caenimonas koreensis DSM 17982]
MAYPLRPIAFVLAASNHGMMIVNRNDYRMVDAAHGYGVGYQILNQSAFDPSEIGLAIALLDARRKHFGSGVCAIDGGANIGVHTIEWARHMHDWGYVMSFEAQEHVYYALAGNIAINNCMNVHAYQAALGEKAGELSIPHANPHVAASFGSLELRKRTNTEFIGQDISYAPEKMTTVPMMTLDSLSLPRCDFVKLDVEGMEADVLKGSLDLIKRTLPILMIEVIKSDQAVLESLLKPLGYQVFNLGMNLLAIHQADPTLKSVKISGNNFTLTA